MRLVKLSVQRFQCIEAAELDFGPGLNVLYGPNDLGKSSLAWAIRAVLLLQHDSTVHKQFVSWYGDAAPRVALTLCDDDDRYWRVTKTFASGTAGRSVLEGSRDGRTFTSDASGRQVDEKLRTMFGWGVQKPGGQGPRGLPESFLTQVLLAEQDSVRKVLFETSLAKDPDEAGRMRLVEALGALAQDPLFKQVLAETQESVDKAFTPKGRKKRSAGSPYLEIAERLKAMQGEHEELGQKVRETEAAEAKIRQLVAERDDLQRGLEEATGVLAVARRQFEARERRDALQAELREHQAAVRGVEDLQRKVDASDGEIARLKVDVETGARQVQEAAAGLARDEAARDAARQHLDTLTHEDVEHERRTRKLEELKQTAQERLDDANRAVENAATALRLARGIANDVASAVVTAAETALQAKRAEEAAETARVAQDVAQQAHADATQRLRDASSDDRARTRELERKELENRRLTQAAEKARLERELAVAGEVGQAVQRADAAKASAEALGSRVERAGEVVAREAAALEELEVASGRLRQLEALGELQLLRATAETEARASASAQQARDVAVGLRAQEAALRGKVRPGLPGVEAIVALRDLREQRRTADARLGGGIAVTVRPRQPVTLSATADGVVIPVASTGAAVVLSANQVLGLVIGELVELEVTAGEEGARQAAAVLRERWNQEGTRVLADHGVDTIEQLEALRRESDVAQHGADQLARDAAVQESLGAQLPPVADGGERGRRIAELESELGAVNRDELAARLAGLGERWQTTLKRQTEENAAARKKHAAELDGAREQLTRVQVQLESQGREAEALARDVARRQEQLTEPWSALVDRHQRAIAVIVRDLGTLAAQAARLEGGSTEAQQSAAQAVASTKRELEAATSAYEACLGRSQQARDASIGAITKLEGARARARELDVLGTWTAELAASTATLGLLRWQEAVTAAEELREQRKVASDAAGVRLVEHGVARAATIQRARGAAADAERAAVATRGTLSALETAHDATVAAYNQAQLVAAEAKVQLARTNVEDARRAISGLCDQIAALDEAVGPGSADAEGLARQEKTVERLAGQVRDANEELAKARGGLEQVGGAIVRERLRELEQAIHQAREREHQIEVEYDAWKLLLDTLRSSESSEGAHLGRALAGPVSKRFQQLTGGRYENLELGAHLETAGLQVAGELRDISALSAGTQDQLATLLRLCIAEQLHSAIVLDDHLSQSDPGRVAWFNDVLRSAAQQVQIIFITCRPGELLDASERPRAGESAFVGAGGLTRSVDLSLVIRRFGAAAGAARRSGG